MVKIKGKLRFTQSIPYYSLSGNRIVKRIAEKKHECFICRGYIMEGETEIEITGQDEGRFYTVYSHPECFGLR